MAHSVRRIEESLGIRQIEAEKGLRVVDGLYHIEDGRAELEIEAVQSF